MKNEIELEYGLFLSSSNSMLLFGNSFVNPPKMIVSVARITKDFLAFTTLMWFDSSVNIHVVIIRSFVVEFLSTIFLKAAISTRVLVMSFSMLT